MSRENLESGYRSTFTINHPDGPIRLLCKTSEGGNVEREKGQRRNARTGKVEATGGLGTPGELTVTIDVDLALWDLKDRIEESADASDTFTFVKVAVDGRNKVTRTVQTETGRVGDTNWPNMDIDGGDNQAELEIVSGVDQK